MRYIEPTCNLPELPLSVLLPIGEKGRSIFFENIKDDRAKHHVTVGQAVFFMEMSLMLVQFRKQTTN